MAGGSATGNVNNYRYNSPISNTVQACATAWSEHFNGAGSIEGSTYISGQSLKRAWSKMAEGVSIHCDDRLSDSFQRGPWYSNAWRCESDVILIYS